MENNDHWYGHVLRRAEGHVLRRALEFEVEDQRKKWRQKHVMIDGMEGKTFQAMVVYLAENVSSLEDSS